MNTNALKQTNMSKDTLIYDMGKKRKKHNYCASKKNTYMTPDLLDSPIYDDELMSRVMTGISQNIWIEMDKQGMTVRGLAAISGVNYSGLSKIFNNKANIGLASLIKIAAALHVSPHELFPYDNNTRKTNGQIFDEMTKSMNVRSINFLLTVVAEYAKIQF